MTRGCEAGRSQVGSSWFLSLTCFSQPRCPVATLLSTLWVSDLIARCKLGVLVSAAAAT